MRTMSLIAAAGIGIVAATSTAGDLPTPLSFSDETGTRIVQTVP